MMSTLSPVVHRSKTSWMTSSAIFVLAHLVSAIPVGGIIGWVGRSVPIPARLELTLTVCALLGIVYCLVDLKVFRLPKPMWKRQVPARWRVVLHPWTAALLYGLELGPGLFVYIRGSAYYLLIAGILVAGNPMLGAVVLGTYALMRSLVPVILGYMSRDKDVNHVAMQLGSEAQVQDARGGLALALLAGLNIVTLLLSVMDR